MLHEPQVSPIIEFIITFENDNEAAFYVGENLSGQVSLNISREIFVKTLTLSVIGDIDVRWKRGGVNIQRKESLLKENSKLVGEKQLVEGTHEFVFKSPIPQSLPSSFEGRRGFVRYMCAASLLYSVANSDDKIKIAARRGFTILRKNDINKYDVELLRPILKHGTQKLGLFSCTSGRMRFNLSVPRTAYVAGESLPISGRIENKTAKRIERAAVTLQMHVDYCGTKSADTLRETIDISEEVVGFYIDPDSSTKIERNFTIPALVPSTVSKDTLHSTCAIVVNYELLFLIRTPGLSDLECRIPIFIGTEPLESSINRFGCLLPGRSKGPSMFRQPKSEKAVDIGRNDEKYACPPEHLKLANHYPFFSDLLTSSKQSKKVATIVNLIKAQKAFHRSVTKSASSNKIAETEQPSNTSV